MGSPAAAPESRARLILYVGKGGVGKTTLAAATAARAAQLGHRTLVVSTDIAHSLGDVLATALHDEPRMVGERLAAQEINVLEEARRSWGKVQSQVSDFLRKEGIPDVQADELAILPGMQEVAALVQIGRQCRTGEYDCIVVDAAPTGETIRLLSMPDSVRWYAGRLRSWRGRLNRVARGLLKSALPDLNVIDMLDDLAVRVRDLRAQLTDARHSSYRIVVTADRMVLKEAQRAETYLNLFEYPIDAVILNRILPAAETGNAYLDGLTARQAQTIADVRAAFSTLPMLEAPLLVNEPIGCAALADLGGQVFGARDPIAVMHIGPTQRIERRGTTYVLQIPMPNVEAERLALTKRGDELYVEVGSFRREIALPRTLASLVPGVAKLSNGVLEIPFDRNSHAAGGVQV